MIKDYPPYLDYPKPRKPLTNADRLRAMNDEELANTMHFLLVAYDFRNPASILDWLRQEASDG